MMYCRKCGKEIADDSRFCSGCGEQIDAESQEINYDDGGKRIEKKAHNNTLFFIIAGIVVVVAVILLKPKDKVIDNIMEENPETNTEEGVADGEDKSEGVYSRSGDYIVFGKYEQDGDTANGSESIEWDVLDESDDWIFLISRYVLDCQPYNKDYVDVTWETCTLRNWLNDDFYNTAFSPSEQKIISTVRHSNPEYYRYGVEDANYLDDKIFCLNVQEIETLYTFDKWNEEGLRGTCSMLKTAPTPYAVSCGVSVHTDDTGWWWLRSRADYTIFKQACFVDHFGETGCDKGTNIDDGLGIRPALYISKRVDITDSVIEESHESDSYVVSGNFILFGNYNQDYFNNDGPQPIEWEILDETDGKMLLISRYVLNIAPYDTETVPATWNDSFLRQWLNDGFYNKAFNAAEQRRIITTDVCNQDNEYFGIDGGDDTQDKMFCLSLEEVKKYYDFVELDNADIYGYSEGLIAESTENVITTQWIIDEDAYDKFLGDFGYSREVIGKCGVCWWLRSIGNDTVPAYGVNPVGMVGLFSSDEWVAYNKYGVRPAMWIEK